MARSRRPAAGGGARRGLTIEVHGLDRLVEQLDSMPEHLQEALRRVVRECAEDVQRETLLNVRKDTGFLQKSLKIKYTRKGLRAAVGWFNADAYYASFQEFGTKSIPAKPALGPAIEGERNRIRERIITALNEELQKIGKSGGGG